MNQYPLCRAFDPSIQITSQTVSANVQNGPKTTEKAEPIGKFDKLLILRGGGSYYNMVGAIPFFKIIFLRSPFFMSHPIRSCYSESKF